MTFEKHLLLAINSEGNPTLMGIFDTWGEAKTAALPFKGTPANPMIQVIVLETEGLSNGNDDLVSSSH